MKFRSLLLAALSAALLCGQGREFYASPEGTSRASGSMDDPWNLETALNHPSVLLPGDVIWLRGGRYGDGTGRQRFFSRLKGTAENPIIVRGYPGERATIDGGLVLVDGESTWYWDFEITSSEKDRIGGTDGSTRLPEGIICRSPNTKLINLVIHDTAQGMGVWQEAPDTEVYGNLIYHNGYQSTSRGHGHGIYFQNKEGSKLLADNIIFNQFGTGLHGYGTSSAFVRNVTLEGNIVFSNGALSAREQYDDNIILGPGSALGDIAVRDNLTYFPPRAAGYSRIGSQFSPQNDNVSVTGNYFIGGFVAVMMGRWQQAEFARNTVYSDNGHTVMLDLLPQQSPREYVWGGNTYYGKSFFTVTAPTKSYDWNQWRTVTGLDADSVFQLSKPTGLWTFVRPNKFDADRANIAIYNWDSAKSVDVDLSSILTCGDTFEIRDAQNYYGEPVVRATFEGMPVAIPMEGLTMAAPNGEGTITLSQGTFQVPTPPKHTAPEFGAFILVRTGRAAE
ncbi:MAG: right-handed parallel beta-helix repeat-containing protein [Bryobacteraceae bacterium]|nr:right-handed parallel beta-helix repeat-containing protein [Bryobacteraceae bacterium]